MLIVGRCRILESISEYWNRIENTFPDRVVFFRFLLDLWNDSCLELRYGFLLLCMWAAPSFSLQNFLRSIDFHPAGFFWILEACLNLIRLPLEYSNTGSVFNRLIVFSLSLAILKSNIARMWLSRGALIALQPMISVWGMVARIWWSDRDVYVILVFGGIYSKWHIRWRHKAKALSLAPSRLAQSSWLRIKNLLQVEILVNVSLMSKI